MGSRLAGTIEDLHIFKVRKGSSTIDIPAPWVGSLCFEMMSPKVMLDELERQRNMGPAVSGVYMLSNFVNNQEVWN